LQLLHWGALTDSLLLDLLVCLKHPTLNLLLLLLLLLLLVVVVVHALSAVGVDGQPAG
jgi:hypothetical protein